MVGILTAVFLTAAGGAKKPTPKWQVELVGEGAKDSEFLVCRQLPNRHLRCYDLVEFFHAIGARIVPADTVPDEKPKTEL